MTALYSQPQLIKELTGLYLLHLLRSCKCPISWSTQIRAIPSEWLYALLYAIFSQNLLAWHDKAALLPTYQSRQLRLSWKYLKLSAWQDKAVLLSTYYSRQSCLFMKIYLKKQHSHLSLSENKCKGEIMQSAYLEINSWLCDMMMASSLSVYLLSQTSLLQFKRHYQISTSMAYTGWISHILSFH